MNKDRFEHLPPDIRQAIEAQSGTVLVDRFGALWDKWDAPVRDGATGSGQLVITPDAAAMTGWRDALRPVTDAYLSGLSAHGFAGARDVYDRIRTLLPAN
jgi:TRAP-type C4-dicarboxylate transport system substrate-binding protein